MRAPKKEPSIDDFLKQCKNKLAQRQETEARLVLHTLKAILWDNFPHVSELIHKTEDKVVLTLADIVPIETAINQYILSGNQNINNPASKKATEIETLKRSVQTWVENARKKPILELLLPALNSSQTLADQLSKKIQFVVTPPNLCLSQLQLSPILAVLPLLLRNAIDHGIEHSGAIHLQFEQNDTSLKAQISDDGIGMDENEIAQAAVRSGRISQKQVKQLSKNEKLALVFLGGVSTQNTATLISGRGIGLSAAFRHIQGADGSLTLKSEKGKGTTIEIVIPLR